MNDYFKLIISGLQNQDPTQPTDTSTILNQISQLMNVESTQNLQSSLGAVALGQTVSNASNLVGKTIEGLDSSGNQVVGVVGSATISNGAATLQVTNSSSGKTSSVTLNNVTGVAG
jgi:flagellar basal-body rod modification protein FlgD